MTERERDNLAHAIMGPIIGLMILATLYFVVLP